MLDRIGIMRMAGQMGAHAAARQSQVARNVANADTPGYRAQDLRDFTDSIDAPATGLRATRRQHIPASEPTGALSRIDAGGEPSPNGNTVSIEDELVRQADAKRQFDLSLSVYQSGLSLLRTSLGRR